MRQISPKVGATEVEWGRVLWRGGRAVEEGRREEV